MFDLEVSTLLILTNFAYDVLRWKSCDERKFDNNFPPEKQFLITERVPCMKRIAEVESAASAI